MSGKFSMRLLCGCALAVLTLVGQLQAAVVMPTKANGDFISGAGIPSDNFTGSVGATNEAVYLKARSRDTGEALSIVGNKYYVSAGLASDNVNPSWTFDYQFSPGAPPAASNYTLRLDVDFDPTVGVADFKTLSFPIFDGDTSPFNSWDDTDGYFTNPGSGAWNENSTPYVIANTAHLGFSFWNAVGPSTMTYNPNTPGEYEIRLTALDATGATTIATTTVFAEVSAVPEASQILMLSLALVGCGLAAYIRHR
jgi:hypothetical protein